MYVECSLVRPTREGKCIPFTANIQRKFHLCHSLLSNSGSFRQMHTLLGLRPVSILQVSWYFPTNLHHWPSHKRPMGQSSRWQIESILMRHKLCHITSCLKQQKNIMGTQHENVAPPTSEALLKRRQIDTQFR